jgi:hypothetical protein
MREHLVLKQKQKIDTGTRKQVLTPNRIRETTSSRCNEAAMG